MRAATILTLLAVTATVPASAAEPPPVSPSAGGAIYDVHAVHLNVYRPLDALDSAPDANSSTEAGEDPAPEVSMNIGLVEPLFDPDGFYPAESGGCVEIFVDGILDGGCGPLAITYDGLTGATHVAGVLSTQAQDISEWPWTDLGESEITIDLLFTATGPPELSPHSTFGAGVCAFPPPIRGGFVILRPETVRDAVGAGTLSSNVLGAVDMAPYAPQIVDVVGVDGGACV